MTDEFNDDLDEDIGFLPADDDQDDDLDEDFGFSFDGLTQAEIDAINSEDDDEEDESGSQGDDDDSAADGTGEANDGKNPKQANGTDDSAADNAATGEQAEWEAEAATLAEKRAAIDNEYDAEVEKLTDLGRKWDDGEIADGAYNAEKAKIDRNLKRIEAREATLVTKEDSVNERQSSAEQQQQDEFIAIATAFFDKPENSVFVQGSPEHAALSQQYDFAVANNPVGTPYDVLLNKARQAVSVHMTLPEVTKGVAKKMKPEDKIMPSISTMPSVVANNPDAGKYQHLDKLSGQDYENAIAGMSEEQQRQYLHG